MVVSLDLLSGRGGRRKLTAKTDVFQWAGGLERCYQIHYTSWVSQVRCRLRDYHSAKHICSLKLKHTVSSPKIALNYSLQVLKEGGERGHIAKACGDSQWSPNVPCVSQGRLDSTAVTNTFPNPSDFVQLFISQSDVI